MRLRRLGFGPLLVPGADLLADHPPAHSSTLEPTGAIVVPSLWPSSSPGPRRLGVLALADEGPSDEKALAAFARRYPHGNLTALAALLGNLRADQTSAALYRGVDLAQIDPAWLFEKLCKDERVIDLDQWLRENLGSMTGRIEGFQGRLDHLSELREAEVRLRDVPPGCRLSVAENAIPGTDRFADLKSDEAYVEVKTVREPLRGWLLVTGQLSDAIQKFSATKDDGRRREAVVYAALDPELYTGIARGNVMLRYGDGITSRHRIDTGALIHAEPYWAPALGWLNALSTKVPLDNPGFHRVDRIHIRVDGGVDATFERVGTRWISS